MKIYKAVFKGSEKDTFLPWSTINNITIPKYNKYKIGETTKRKNGWGPLCGFPDLETCIDFILKNGRDYLTIVAVLEATGKRSEDTESIWYPIGRQRYSIIKNDLPRNTVLLDEITIVRPLLTRMDEFLLYLRTKERANSEVKQLLHSFTRIANS